MPYRVVIPRKVQKDFNKVEKRFRARMLAALAALSSNPYLGKKLEGEHKGEWSCRVWPYRIIYQIKKKELIILVIRIGHRREAY